MWKDLPYIHVLCLKIFCGTNLLTKLVRVENMEDCTRMSDVAKAIEHNRGLIAELGLEPSAIARTVKYYTKEYNVK